MVALYVLLLKPLLCWLLLLNSHHCSSQKCHHCSPLTPHREGDKLVPSVQKKINELEVGLLHLQQNIDIPEITLTVHPHIVAAVKKAAEAGRRSKVEDLEESVSDSSFLNAIQKDVSRWVREIQKVGRWVNDHYMWFYHNLCVHMAPPSPHKYSMLSTTIPPPFLYR